MHRPASIGSVIGVLVSALFTLASQGGAAEFGNPYTAGAGLGSTRSTSGRTTPSLSSKAQVADDGTTPSQVTGPASNPHATQATLGINVHNIGYKIGPLDVLEISVFEVPDLSRTVQVADNGNVSLPLLGDTPAAGRTPEELERDLQARLGANYLQHPQVTVLVKEFKSRHVTISGAIKAPGVYPITTETSLEQLVATAGGFTDVSNSTVLVLRGTGGRRSAATFDVAAIEAGRARDPIIQPGDLIVAGESDIKRGYNTILKVLPLAGIAAIGGL
jgi:polysaccharide biosynthesis/export protein